jgi:hypothetical protein
MEIAHLNMGEQGPIQQKYYDSSLLRICRYVVRAIKAAEGRKSCARLSQTQRAFEPYQRREWVKIACESRRWWSASGMEWQRREHM